ncbi:MAG: hypothetical protein ACRYFX_05030 [Janthinobacterium lividum]
MKKNKNKKAAKKKVGLLGGAAKSLSKLSSTQKVLAGAGATLGALGIRYLVKKRQAKAATAPDAGGAEDALHSLVDGQ